MCAPPLVNSAPTFDRSDDQDGFVSFECTPDLADDADATIAQGTNSGSDSTQPNVMIKVPGTEAGLSQSRS